jgi:hypothetical protein
MILMEQSFPSKVVHPPKEMEGKIKLLLLEVFRVKKEVWCFHYQWLINMLL